ncbi:MAG: hypothetical protein Q4B01_10115 [Eubacteriales bacterium]|nr:hypothetical protein [Eubacteriales bacterium]
MTEDIMMVMVMMLGFAICGLFVVKIVGLIDEINGYEKKHETYRVHMRKNRRKRYRVSMMDQFYAKCLEIYERRAYSKYISTRKR